VDKYEDPLNRLGFGFISFFELLKTLIVFLLIMTLINIPLYIMYSRNQVVTDRYGGLTLGNLGESESICKSAKLSKRTLDLLCNDGVITAFTHYGLYA
jgi:hypothetical protein